MKALRTLAILAIIIIPIISLAGCAITQYNKEETVRTSFETEFRVRTAQYSKLGKVLKGKGIVAKTNDSSFLRVVNAIMEGRKDGANLGMKWIQEQNPSAQFGEVSALYKDLSRAIEAERNSFFEEEKKLSDIKGQHDLLLRRFPGSVFFSMLGTQPIQYKVISDTETNNAVRTGVDDSSSPF